MLLHITDDVTRSDETFDLIKILLHHRTIWFLFVFCSVLGLACGRLITGNTCQGQHAGYKRHLYFVYAGYADTVALTRIVILRTLVL